MAILGNIRKRPIFLVMIIGLALFAFVISGIFTDNGSNRNNIGSINGNDISGEEFARRLDVQRNRNQNGSSIQNVNTVWNSLVREKIYEDQIEKSGITVSENDIWNSMINNPAYQNSPNFKNEEGLFDEDKLKEFIATMKSTPQGKLNWLNAEKNIVNSLKQTSYDNLVKAGLTASLKEGQQFYTSNNTSADIKYVFEPYTSIKEVKVSDAEITAYIKNHADEFEVEASTEIEYVNFEVKPSAEDIAKVKTDLTVLINDFVEDGTTIPGLKNTTDYVSFVNEFSDINYEDKVYFANDLMTGVYDSIKNLPKGSVYGPYIDGDYYKLIKFIDKKNEFSVKSSHILLAYEGSASQKPDVTRTKEEAEKEAKRLFRIANATNFAELAKTNSDDSSASRGGELGGWYKEDGKLVKEYSDFIFNNRKGKIGMVETVFGYHIIKIDETKTEPGLNIALIANKIDASPETESNVYQQAETFASDLIDGKDILELAKTSNYAIKKANNLKALSESIIGLGNQRDIVKWTYEKGTKIGDVKRFDLENSFVIVILKNKLNKGLKSLASSKPIVVPILEKIKKGQLIKEKMVGSTLEDIAKSVGKSVNSTNGVSIMKPALSVGGSDENITGALLYMKQGDIKIVEGKNGVYAIEIIKKIPLYDIKKYDTYSKTITTQLKNKTTQVFNALKNASEVDDQRATRY